MRIRNNWKGIKIMEINKILTISIAAYNVEKYLEKALSSCVIDSLMEKLEVIIVNDGSTDNTLNIAKKYSSKYPNTFFVIDKENGGYGSTINASLKIARGKYFKLLDGDDWFDTDELRTLVLKLMNHDEDLIITKFKRVFESDCHEEIRDEGAKLNPNEHNLNNIVTYDWFTMAAIVWKTKLLIDSNLHVTEHCFYTDQEYDLIPYASANSICVLDCIVYCYRIGRAEQSVSLASIEKHYKDQITVYNKLVNMYKALDVQSGKSRYIYNYLVKRAAVIVWSMLVIEESIEHKKELVGFINSLNESVPEIYRQLLKSSRLTKILVYSNYMLYGILHKLKVRNASNM